MRPFPAFRMWLRRSPLSERVAAAVATAIVLGLLAWMLVPEDTDTETAIAGPTAAPIAGQQTPSGQVQSPGVGAAQEVDGVTPDGPSAPAGTQGTASQGAGDDTTQPQRSCPSGTTTGVTDREMKIAVGLVNVLGVSSNEAFGLDNPDVQREDVQAVIDGINDEGGIGCRKVVAQYFVLDPANPDRLHSQCLEIAQSGAFAFFDSGGYAKTGPLCFAQQKIPYFGGYLLTRKQAAQGFPYLFDLGSFDHLYHDTIYALRDRGFFDAAKGFRKLGIFYQDCHPELIDRTLRDLRDIGVGADRTSTYNFGCPSTFANPVDIRNAVDQFRREGVSHMTQVNALGDIQRFTQVAQNGGINPFKPVWGLPDDQLVGVAYGSQRPDPDNIAGAVAITQSRNGEERTPGSSPTPGTVRCNRYYAAAGKPPVYQRKQAAGNNCAVLWMLQGAFEKAPQMSRTALAAGLQATRSIDFSYPQGPNDFSRQGVTWAGQAWRVIQFDRGCECWKVIDPIFHPSFAL